MGVYKNRPDGKTVRRNQIPKGVQWTWWTIEMLEAPAYQVLSLSAHRAIARIRIEHAHHAGKENGKLVVTFRNFHEFGIHWNAIAPAVRESEALGWIRVTQYGVASNGEFRIPTKFALTHLETVDNPKPTDDWRRIKTVEEAERIAKAARKAKARYGRFHPRKAKPKTDLRYGNRSGDGYGNRSENSQNPTTETVSPQLQKPYHLLYFGEEPRQRRLGGRHDQTSRDLCPRLDRQADGENQVRELRQIAERRGWEIVARRRHQRGPSIA